MKRSGFKIKPRKPLKRSGFKKRKVKLKRELMPNRVKHAKKELTQLSHIFVRKRDSVKKDVIGGYCCSCGKYCEGPHFQAGHWEADSSGGALLRYHPHNMHGQGDYCCNINRHGQQVMGNAYTLFMIEKYGLSYVNQLRALKTKSIKADIIFYERMIELYKEGDEDKIVEYLHSLVI